MKKDTSIGVIVGRFQTPELHPGHRFVIDSVFARHDEVLIVLGCSAAYQSKHDPLDYETRKAMVLSKYPGARIAALKDTRTNELWSKNLDNLIEKEFPGRLATLYGSLKSFIPCYNGIHPCTTLESPDPNMSATNARNDISVKPGSSKDFRAGAIYASYHRKNISHQTTDVAVIDYDRRLLLLGARNADGGKLRFIGGFVDATDATLEAAAKREVIEETSHIEIDDLRYLASFRINDWRYRGQEDAILTAFFAARYIFGAPIASDDLDDLAWVPWQDFTGTLVDEHKPLGLMLEKYLETKSEKGERQ